MACDLRDDAPLEAETIGEIPDTSTPQHPNTDPKETRMTTTAPTQLAIHGGTPVRTRPWPKWPVYDETEIEALTDVVRSGQWFSHSGRKVVEFAAAFARLQQAKFAAPCTNG